MFKKNKELKILAIGALLLSVFGLVVSYIALSTSLNIREANHVWDVDIVDVSIDNIGSVSNSNMEIESTSLNNMNISFSGSGSVVYNFKLKNNGAVDAVLRYINFGRGLCTGSECDKVSYKLTYADGREVLEGDVVNYETNMAMCLVVSYEGTGVNIEDFDFILLYEQG